MAFVECKIKVVEPVSADPTTTNHCTSLLSFHLSGRQNGLGTRFKSRKSECHVLKHVKDT